MCQQEVCYMYTVCYGINVYWEFRGTVEVCCMCFGIDVYWGPWGTPVYQGAGVRHDSPLSYQNLP